MRVQGEFQPCDFPHKHVIGKADPVSYVVYRDEQEYVLVEAGTAMEAVTKSGVTAPYRIMKNTLSCDRLIHSQVLE